MSNGKWFSLIITRKTLIIGLIILLIIIIALTHATMFEYITRRMHGVKPGVVILGHDLSGLLEHELYDALISISEGETVEVQNASYDWHSNIVYPEIIGKVIDIGATISSLMQAPVNSQVEFSLIYVIPSITQAHFSPFYHGATDEQKVSLMINVDWGNEYIPSMLETFKRYDVLTTWFPTGSWVERFPELALQIADAGHELGNHGGWHGKASEMNADQVRDLILTGEEKIVNITGQKPMLFAPPGGNMNKQTVAVAAELGYKTIMWTIDTVDWQRPAPTVIIDRVITRIQNGSFVLMHPTEPTAYALPLIIEQLREKGYEIVPVSQLLYE